MTPDGYLRAVLADGARTFQYRLRVSELLGHPAGSGVRISFGIAAPRRNFVYLRRWSGSADRSVGRTAPQTWWTQTVDDFSDADVPAAAATQEPDRADEPPSRQLPEASQMPGSVVLIPGVTPRLPARERPSGGPLWPSDSKLVGLDPPPGSWSADAEPNVVEPEARQSIAAGPQPVSLGAGERLPEPHSGPHGSVPASDAQRDVGRDGSAGVLASRSFEAAQLDDRPSASASMSAPAPIRASMVGSSFLSAQPIPSAAMEAERVDNQRLDSHRRTPASRTLATAADASVAAGPQDEWAGQSQQSTSQPADTAGQRAATPQLIVVRQPAPEESTAAFWERRQLGRLSLRSGLLR